MTALLFSSLLFSSLLFSSLLFSSSFLSSFSSQLLTGIRFFHSEYPKLLRLFKDFHKRLHTHYEIKQQPSASVSSASLTGSSSGINNTVNSVFNEEQAILLKTLSRFETAYLGRCVSKLSGESCVFSSFLLLSSYPLPSFLLLSFLLSFILPVEPINLMFTSSGGRAVTTPSSEDVASFARIITTEFEASLVDANLTQAIGKTVGKTLKHFVVRTENLTITEPEAHQGKVEKESRAEQDRETDKSSEEKMRD
jgi:hypothetical protein